MMKMLTLSNARTIFAAAAFFALPMVVKADFTKTNPVTGETENYTWKFVGTDTWNGTGNWQNSSGANPSGTPAKSGENTWDPILFDGDTININASMSVEGWNLRMGLYNGANITMNTFVKYQGDTTMWMTVDESSQLTIGGFGGGNITANQVIKLSVAKANGITWNVNLASGNANNTFEYYLKGAGSVSYQAVSAANHKIKMADVTLSGNEKSVQSKTLVSFTSSTPTFTADAAIKVKNSSDEVVRTVNLSSVNSTGTTTLTTDNAVGMCELVKTATGIVLYWVDGDPDDISPYKPSININFTNGAGNGLTTSADVGLDGYAVPGTSWNNFTIPNNANEQTFNTVNAIDSTGAASVAAGVSVKVSGHRGSYSCSNLTAANNPLQGYIDEGADKATPAVTITGIPYEHYRVIVYHSTDTARLPFGYDTINGFNFTYVNGVQTSGTDSWGSSGANQSAEPIAEGTNTLVSAVLSGDTVTMVAHRVGGATPTARGCFAAIQVVEYVPEVGENDLEIAVDGATNYAVDTAKTLSGTVYLTGSGTLTLTGSEKITAATIDVAKDVVLNINADRLDATTFTGSGTVVYDTTAPVEGKGWANIGWSGTVWIKNQSVSSFEGTKFGNAGSTVRFTGVTGFLQTSSWNGSTYVHTVPLELVDEGNTIAFTYNNGWGGNLVKINTLKGTGTLKTQGSGAGEHIYIVDASGFSGVFNLTAKSVYVGGDAPAYSDSTGQSGKLEIRSGVTMTVPAGKTWTANGGFVVNGTIVANGTLASSASSAVSGSGTVVFGGVPSPTGDTWWKNAAWTGTVEIQGVTALNGDYNFNDYGNRGSTLKLTNCRGWLKTNYTCVPALEIGGTFTWNDGGSGLNQTFKVGTLKGSGTISIPNGGAPTAVWQITDDWSGFTGSVIGNNTAAARVMVFGSILPTTINAGEIHVSEGATLDLDNSSSAWWGVGMGFVVNGTVKASARNKWGGGTYMKLGDTGVLELTSTGNVNDSTTGTSPTSADFSNVTGTGTIKYSSTAGWRAFPDQDAKMPASTVGIQVELADSLIISKSNGETVIGSLSGLKNIRSDFNNNGANGRILTVTQSKDTEWQGKFVSNRITQFNVVAPAVGTPGTLTLSGTQEATIPMQVNGAVNLTGTWVGATTVAGTIGGTGTLTGNLTFNTGSTFKAFASDDNGLSVSGSITYPESGTVTVDVSALGAPAVLLTAASESDINLSKFKLADGTTGYKLVKEDATLKVIEVFSLVQRAGGENVEVEATGALLQSLVNSGFSATPSSTTDDVNEFLNATDPNGLRRWENLATGTATNQPPLGTVSAETTSGNALSVKMVAVTNGIDKVDFGYTVLRELRKGDGTRVAGPSPDGTAFDIGLLNDSGASMGASGFYRVVTLLTCGPVVNEIPSTNAVGIVEVASTATNTITAVPWKRLASAPGEASDLTVSNFVAFANLSDGDAVYMLDGRAYKMWKNNNGTWVASTTVGNNGASITLTEAGSPDEATIPCGGAVWVQRADATKPYFLVGQYDESAFSVTVPGSGAALIANPFTTNVTLNAIDWSGYAGVNKDTIRIRNPKNGLYVGLSYDYDETETPGKWGWGQYRPTSSGGTISGKTFKLYDGDISAGTGFLYYRKSGEGFTFEWK